MVEAASETMSSKMTRFFHVFVIFLSILYPGSALPNYICPKTLPENDPNLGIKRVNSLYQFETNDTLCQLKKEIPYSYHHDKEFEKEFCECERPKSEINGVVKEYHDNGNLASETRYEDSQKEGSGKYYDKNNKFSVTISYQLDKAVSGICRSQAGKEIPLTNAEIMNWNNGLATGCE